MSEVKFTDDELSKLKEIQQNYVNIQNQFGQIAITKIKLDKPQEFKLSNSRCFSL